MSDWKEDAIRHKYDPLPDEARYRKKSKKLHVKSHHKHDYEEVCVDAHDYMTVNGESCKYYEVATRCKVCGKVGNVKLRHDLHEPPDGMPLYEVKDFIELFGMKYLPDEKRVR